MSRPLGFALVAIHFLLFMVTLDAILRRAPAPMDILMPIPDEVLVAFGAAVPEMFARGDVWRLVTAALLHANAIHLAVSALLVAYAVRAAEPILGRWPVALALVLGAVFSSTAAAATGERAAGAAGAGLAVLGLIAMGVPAGFPLGGKIRRQAFMSAGIFVGISFLFTYLEGEGRTEAIAYGNLRNVAGFGAGFALGALRSAIPAGAIRAGAALAVLGALASVGFGIANAGSTVSRAMTGETSLGAEILTGGPQRAVALPSLGVVVQVPEGWYEIKSTATVAVYGPQRGWPAFQVIVARRERGSFGPPDLGSPDGAVALARDEIERHGAEDIMIAPFREERVDGVPATRIELRYRQQGMDLQMIRYVVRGRESVYLLAFLGMGSSAEMFADRIVPTVKLVRERK